MNAFFDAVELFLETNRKYLDILCKDQRETLKSIINLLRQAKERRKIVHTVGMGRSGLVGRIFADSLKIKGFESSVIGDTFAKPVSRGDIVFAFSGSGWTRTTTLYSELAIQRGAILIGFTAAKKSKLDRLADYTVYLLGKPEISSIDYVARKIAGKYKTPLAPMGSIPEYSALLAVVALFAAIDSKDIISACRDTLINLRKSCHTALKNIETTIFDVIERYKQAIENRNRIFFLGLGILDYISKMIAMRFQHLGATVSGLSDWILRKPKDVLTLFSASGEADVILIMAKSAKMVNLDIVGVTGNAESQLAKLSDKVLILGGGENRRNYFEVRVDEANKFTPIFELVAFIIFEAIVAELAYRLGITEDIMKGRHANIE